MNPITADMKDLLVAASIGIFGTNPSPSGWSIFIGGEPDEPDRTITLYDTPGEPPNPKFLLDYPNFQARVRGNDYAAVWAKAIEVRDCFLGLTPQAINGVWYSGVFVTVDVAFLFRDVNDRTVFTVNFRSIREPTSGTHRQSL